MTTFNMQEIGRKIASLRKEKNMTQMDLADRVGISFQAVSNWERGLTMPDISKLPELAELFGVSVDEILGNKEAAAVVTEIAEGNVPENLDGKTIADVAPILKPDQLKKTVDSNSKQIDLSALIALAPFLDCDELYDMILDLTKDGKIKCGDLAALAPYMDCDDVAKTVTALINKGDGNEAELAALAPFMDSDDIGKIAIDGVKAGKIAENALVALAPFMDSDDIGKIAIDGVKAGKIAENALVALAPFMDSDDLKTVVKILLKNGNADGDSIKKIIELL